MKFDFIPVELYTSYYYFAILTIVIILFFDLQGGFKRSNFGYFLVLSIIIYMGFRPLSGRYFVDMVSYNQFFVRYQNGYEIDQEATDVFFHLFVKWCAGVMTVDYFFLTCAFLYVYPLYLVSKKWFEEYWFYSFLFLVASFSFWAYGTNGIRNGIASSFFLLAMSRDRRIFQVLWIILAINFHKTMLLPTAGFILANIYNQPKKMMLFWFMCIPISLVVGSSLELLIGSSGAFDDQRASYLTGGNVNQDEFSSTGFRWDFLMYSATAVFAGWYYIYKKNFNDKIYFWIFNTYLFANALWILVIRANFSNRFAYLSWFMIALVIVYPLLTTNLLLKQSRKLAVIMLAYFFFTYLMNVILFKA